MKSWKKKIPDIDHICYEQQAQECPSKSFNGFIFPTMTQKALTASLLTWFDNTKMQMLFPSSGLKVSLQAKKPIYEPI